MNKKLASLIIKIAANGAEAEATLRTLEKRVGNFGKGMERIGSSLSKYVTAPLTALAGVSVAAANTQLQAEAKLLNALRGREDVQQRLMEQASELQSRSTLGDETIINQQAFLAALGLTETQIRQTIEAAVQLSYATGMELDGAVKNLAKTYSGLTGELGESIPALKQFTAEELKAGDAVAYINENYKGFAEVAASTGGGPVVQLKNQLGDLAEQIGIVLLPTIQKLTEWLSDITSWMQSISPEAMEVIVTIGAVVAAVGPLLTIGGKLITMLKGAVAAIGFVGAALTATPIGAAVTAIGLLAAAWWGVTGAAEAAAEAQRAAIGQTIEDKKAYVAREVRKAWEDRDRQEVWSEYDRVHAKRVELQKQSSEPSLEVILFIEAEKALLGLLKENKDALDAQSETADRILETQDKKTQLTDAELLAQMRIQRAESKRLATLNAILDKEEEIARMKAAYDSTGGKLEGIDTSSANLDSLTTVATDLQNVDTSLVGLKINELRQEFADAEGTANEIAATANNIGNTLANAFVNLTYAIGEGLGNMLAGQEFNFGKTIFTVLGQALKDIGKQIIASSTVIEAIKKTLKGLGLGAWAIPVGMAAVALGQLLVAKAQQPIKLATGGLAYGPTLAVVGDNPGATSDPEVIAPLSKLRDYVGGSRLELVGNVAFELHGDTARAILDRENVRLARLG